MSEGSIEKLTAALAANTDALLKHTAALAGTPAASAPATSGAAAPSTEKAATGKKAAAGKAATATTKAAGTPATEPAQSAGDVLDGLDGPSSDDGLGGDEPTASYADVQKAVFAVRDMNAPASREDAKKILTHFKVASIQAFEEYSDTERAKVVAHAQKIFADFKASKK